MHHVILFVNNFRIVDVQDQVYNALCFIRDKKAKSASDELVKYLIDNWLAVVPGDKDTIPDNGNLHIANRYNVVNMDDFTTAVYDIIADADKDGKQVTCAAIADILFRRNRSKGCKRLQMRDDVKLAVTRLINKGYVLPPVPQICDLEINCWLSASEMFDEISQMEHSA